ncbi:MAG TPA: RluA family pseudouridine synthase [Acidimicrobiales bacterium]|nr:RluA family pseudouridine synthase [Acidimicrobiales bacterium]
MAEPLTGERRAEVPPALDGERLDRVVSLLWGVPRADAAGVVAAGGVRVDGAPVLVRSRRLVAGEVVEVDLPEAEDAGSLVPDPGVLVPVVAVDDHVIVVDKPAGLVVHPGAGHVTGTLVHGLLGRWPEIAGVGDPTRPGIVQRLDAGTSGLLVVARSALAYSSLVAQLTARTVERRYLALVWGWLEAPAGVVDAPVGRAARDRTQMAVSAGGREARTHYRVAGRYDSPAPVTLLECWLETGRTHQIRVHLAAIGHPVVGDSRYGGARPSLRVDRPFLHAFELGFDHPATGARQRYSSPLPPDLEDVREHLN